MNRFTFLVKEYLLKNNLKQKIISDNLNMSSSATSQLLSQDNISLNKMERIAEALDCDLKIELIPKNNTQD